MTPSSFDDIRRLVADMPGADAAAIEAAQARDGQLTKPPGSLGKLEQIALWLAGWQASASPRAERIAQPVTMERQRPVDHLSLAIDAFGIKPGAGPGPVTPRATEQRGRKGCRHGRVADSHLADTGEISLLHRLKTNREGSAGFGFRHRGPGTEIPGRAIKLKRNHGEFGTQERRKLIDRGTAVFEVRDHLEGHLGGKGRDALGGDAMIAGKDH
ncbi:MAG: hypothetical protein HN577_15885, partial [Rhodospirillaceae bacterium]|nr:hypothetical protein [Rhodospirillaceae bacterium]